MEEACRPVDKMPFFIRAPMLDRLRHPGEDSKFNRSPVFIHDSDETAHRVYSLRTLNKLSI
jgi:hypothetical protein